MSKKALKARRFAFSELQRKYAEFPVSSFWQFYTKNIPAEIQRFEAECQRDAKLSTDLLLEMAECFLELEEIGKRSPEEYQRRLELLQSHSRVGRLSRKIVQLEGKGEARTEAESKQLKAACLQLQSALAKDFDLSQQDQLIEMNRLEAELRTMRSLLERREKARELILRQRFEQLSGRPWPTETPASAPAQP